MGTPIKVDVNGTAVFICCEGCRESLLEEPNKYLAKLAERPTADDSPKDVSLADAPQMDLPPIGAMLMLEPQADSDDSQAITEALARLSAADRTLAERQKVCPVTDMPLGSMGTPIKVSVNGRSVFICCEGCRDRLLRRFVVLPCCPACFANVTHCPLSFFRPSSSHYSKSASGPTRPRRHSPGSRQYIPPRAVSAVFQ